MAAADGEETIYWKPVSELQTVLAPYDPEIEALLAGVDSDAIPLRLHPGRFVVFFPEDAHAPGGMSGTQSSTIKNILQRFRSEFPGLLPGCPQDGQPGLFYACANCSANRSASFISNFRRIIFPSNRDRLLLPRQLTTRLSSFP